jgi:hypothetical protein
MYSNVILHDDDCKDKDSTELQVASTSPSISGTTTTKVNWSKASVNFLLQCCYVNMFSAYVLDY